MIRTSFLSALAAALLAPQIAWGQVLGPCGTPDANKPSAAAAAPAAAAPGAAPALQVARIPLPGDQAPNFELPAVVGDQVKNIKLSDYDGKWRIVCFYPADFTFV
ncbi:MAG: redoxin domain-containing protein [Deltaproteobacteria bacterium]|nr:redoxin domain-containing protein [Deltaproteobacteria bacterium]